MATNDKRPGATMVGLAPMRIPTNARARLAKLARRGEEVCRKHGAKILTEISLGLELALLDLQTTELRAKAAEQKTQKALNELGKAQARITELEMYIQSMDEPLEEVPNEFGIPESTAVRENPDPELLRRCKEQ